MRNLCKCGCGKPVSKLSNKYILGHNCRGKHYSKGIPKSEEHKRRLSESHKGKHPSEETKRKMSKNNKGILGKHHSKKTKEKIRKSLEGHHLSEKSKRKVGIASKKHWQTPEYRKKTLKAMFAGRSMKPNRPERRLKNRLNHLFPNEYKYVGNGSILIGYKNPDFININGQKKVIELFGDYWHSKERTGRTKEQEENQRIKHFAKYGFETLIVWEHELKNIPQLKKKIKEFHNG